MTNDDKFYKHICGRRALDHAELTSVRTEAKSGDWPWHIALYVKDKNFNTSTYECGGNIISRTAIITGNGSQ